MEEVQRALEFEQSDRGVERFRMAWAKAMSRGDVGDQPAVKSVIAHHIESTSEAVQDWIDHCKAGRPGPKAKYFKYFPALDADTLAYLTARTVINGLVCKYSYTTIQKELGAAVEDEWRIAKLAEHDPSAIDWVQREVKRRNLTARHMQRAYYHRMAKHRGAVHNPWSSAVKIQVGAILIDLFQQATRLIKVVTIRDGVKQKKLIEVTPQLVSWVIDANDRMALDSPVFMPMVVPPRKWQDGQGGYLTVDLHPVKGRPDQTIPPEVERALDLMNSTVYQVNCKVLEVLKWAVENHDRLGVLDMDFVEIPAKPEDIKTNEKARLDYRKQARDAHDRNNAAASVAMTVRRVIDVAERFANYDKLWFPCEVDFRGRVYPIPTDLNPQGPDYSRGLLQFAEGKFLDTTGAMLWHRVHGANMFGEDKLTLAERSNWVEEHRSQILSVAADPYSNLWWTEAEKPFQFLQWCLDFDEVQRGGPSKIRVSMDGSCNGIQHFSGMLRDPVAAKAVNLAANKKPEDIYQQVADRVQQRMSAEADPALREYARVFLAHAIVDRKVCKRAVMVMPYGGTFKSTMNYVGDEVRARLRDDNPFGDDIGKAANYLAKHVHEATREVVTSGALVMGWFQECAKLVSKAGKHLSWRTPTGFIAEQHYVKSSFKLVKTYLSGNSVVQTRDYEPTGKVDRDSSRNGISPNFVHSLDASAMMKTVIASAGQGVTAFHCIHDDFGTHAADTPTLSRVLREEFVRMYEEHNVLAEFKEYVEADTGVFLPDPPRLMDFDLREVLRSDYFFS